MFLFTTTPTWLWVMVAIDTFVITTALLIRTCVMMRCSHTFVRCLHGDEADEKKALRECLNCGKTLRGRRPEPCFYTGEPHPREESEWPYTK